MSDASLSALLIGMTPAEWYCAAQRARVFLGGRDRLQALLTAYRHRENLVLVLDTATVMARHAAQTTLSPINSGFSQRFPQPRGRETFRSIADYPFEHWSKKRGGAPRPWRNARSRRGDERDGGVGGRRAR